MTYSLDFGAAAVERLPDAVAAVGPTRVLLVTDRGLRAAGVVDRVLEIVDAAGWSVTGYDDVRPNPTTADVDRLADLARDLGPVTVVALGGGSVLDVAKAAALVAANEGRADEFDYRLAPPRPALPIVAVPTTAGTGAETNGFGVIEDPDARRKVYLGHDSARPRRVILDPELTVGLPPGPTAATGMDALVHGIESLASRGSTPTSEARASRAVALVSANLRAAVADGTDLEARSQLLCGSHQAGLALSESGLGLVHGIAHAVTNHSGAAHGLALSAVVEEVMARTLPVARAAYGTLAGALGVGSAETAVAAVGDLADAVGARVRLRDLGVEAAMLPDIAVGALADAVSANHPRTFGSAEVEEMLAAAW
jgi:alcohol dehydrogenase class IV